MFAAGEQNNLMVVDKGNSLSLKLVQGITVNSISGGI
jgi:hypothetical protein